MSRAVSGRPPASARLARALGLDGNPLRRTSDRVEAWIRVSLFAFFLVAGPLTAAAAGHWVWQVTAAETSAAAAHVHPVRAVLVQSAAAPASPVAADWGGQVWVRARWNSAGIQATGDVLAPRGSPAGSLVTAWVDSSGRATASPPEPGQLGNQVALAVLMVLIVEVFALLAVLRLIRRFLDWRRLAAWEAAWSSVGPRWTGRRS